MLGEPEMETEAWKIAEDAYNLKNSALNSSFHDAPFGFLLQTLGLLTSPSLSRIQYQLARSLLENRVNFSFFYYSKIIDLILAVFIIEIS
jgi:hypothetical protein